jgi:hypothetical protein
MSNHEFMSFEEFLKAIIDLLETCDIGYMLGGAVAVWPWGEPRSTQDIDLVVDLSPNDSPLLSKELAKIDIYLPADIILDTLIEERADLPINAIHGSTGFKAEMFPIRAWDELRTNAFTRRRKVNFGSDIGDVYVHSPEDLIIYKLLNYSLSQQTKHVRDIGSIIKVLGENLDYTYIEKWINKKGLRSVWQEIRNQIG